MYQTFLKIAGQNSCNRVKAASAGLLLAFGLLLAGPLHATQFEVSRLAAELNFVSAELAAELKSHRGYGSVRFSADRLSRAAADLVSAIQRNRSTSFLRSEFQDVVRHYNALEDAFLRADREHNRYVYSQVGAISNLFSGLNAEFYYSNYVEPAPQVYYIAPPLVSGRRFMPGYRGHNAGGNPAGRSQQQQPPRRGTGVNRIGLPNNFNHRSRVLERQLRQQSGRAIIVDPATRRGGVIDLRRQP